MQKIEIKEKNKMLLFLKYNFKVGFIIISIVGLFLFVMHSFLYMNDIEFLLGFLLSSLLFSFNLYVLGIFFICIITKSSLKKKILYIFFVILSFVLLCGLVLLSAMIFPKLIWGVLIGIMTPVIIGLINFIKLK